MQYHKFIFNDCTVVVVKVDSQVQIMVQGLSSILGLTSLCPYYLVENQVPYPSKHESIQIHDKTYYTYQVNYPLFLSHLQVVTLVCSDTIFHPLHRLPYFLICIVKTPNCFALLCISIA
jgi:hypothetical protein